LDGDILEELDLRPERSGIYGFKRGYGILDLLLY